MNSLNNVETLVQKAAIKKEWREWLEEIALDLYVSDFQMLKTALPPGWLGRSKLSNRPKKLWWVKLSGNNHEGKISSRLIELKTLKRMPKMIKSLKNLSKLKIMLIC